MDAIFPPRNTKYLLPPSEAGNIPGALSPAFEPKMKFASAYRGGNTQGTVGLFAACARKVPTANDLF
jgi:hypothetical protein